MSALPKSHKHTLDCRLLTLEEAATYTGFTVRTMRHYCYRTIIHAVKLGPQSWRIRLCELDAWIEDRSKRVARGEIVPT